MASQVPTSLKSADINRFAVRAAQLEKVRPVIAYWCEYWIVNQILGRGLHNTDQESLAYTTNLMDKLEQFKADNATDENVVDDGAAKIYVEQFGLDTFQRADNAVRANKSSRQTADTFQAAATFLDLLHIWGNEVDAEVAAKAKYAKFHALRIAKAIKAGEDPNLSNPKLEQPADDIAIEDGDTPIDQGSSRPRQPSVVEVPDEAHRVQRSLAGQSAIDESLHPSREPSMPPGPDTKGRQPSVVEVTDEAHRFQSKLAPQSSLDESLHPSRAPSAPPHDVSPLAHDPSSFYTNGQHDPVSPLASTEERKSSLGGNYFPVIPSSEAQFAPPPSQPSAPADPFIASPYDLPSAPQDPSLPEVPTSFSTFANHLRQSSPTIDTQQQPPQQPHHPSSPPPPTRHHGHFLLSDGSNSSTPSTLTNTTSLPSQSHFAGSQPPSQTVQKSQQAVQHHAPPIPPPHHHNTLPFAAHDSPLPPHFPSRQPPIPPQPQPQAPAPTSLPSFLPPPSTSTPSFSPNPSRAAVSALPLSIPQPAPAPLPTAITPAPASLTLNTDEEAISKAQKHSRWAISALNFEDVPTAVRELRGALVALGALPGGM